MVQHHLGGLLHHVPLSLCPVLFLEAPGGGGGARAAEKASESQTKASGPISIATRLGAGGGSKIQERPAVEHPKGASSSKYAKKIEVQEPKQSGGALQD